MSRVVYVLKLFYERGQQYLSFSGTSSVASQSQSTTNWLKLFQSIRCYSSLKIGSEEQLELRQVHMLMWSEEHNKERKNCALAL